MVKGVSMKKLLLTGLMSLGFVLTASQDGQEKCVKSFIAKISAGVVVEYNDICGCFDVASVNDLSDQQLKQIIKIAVRISRVDNPYEDFRFDIGKNDKVVSNIDLFLNYLDQKQPLINAINDLYLRDRIAQKSGDRQKELMQDGLDMLDHHIAIIEGRKQFTYDSDAILDKLVANPKNLQQLKDMKQELNERYAAMLSKN